jgi:hypothetical protein
MRSSSSAPAPLLFLIGCAFLAGAVVLAWFSALVVLDIQRTDAQSFRASLESRVLGLVPVAATHVDGVRGVVMISDGVPGSTSRTNTHKRLYFETRSGPVDAGYAQQHFGRRYTDLRDFFQEPGQGSFTITSKDGFHETFRFFAAQAAAVFLALVGLMLLYGALRGIIAIFTDEDVGSKKI